MSGTPTTDHQHVVCHDVHPETADGRWQRRHCGECGEQLCDECDLPLYGESTSPDDGVTWVHYTCE